MGSGLRVQGSGFGLSGRGLPEVLGLAPRSRQVMAHRAACTCSHPMRHLSTAGPCFTSAGHGSNKTKTNFDNKTGKNQRVGFVPRRVVTLQLKRLHISANTATQVVFWWHLIVPGPWELEPLLQNYREIKIKRALRGDAGIGAFWELGPFWNWSLFYRGGCLLRRRPGTKRRGSLVWGSGLKAWCLVFVLEGLWCTVWGSAPRV